MDLNSIESKEILRRLSRHHPEAICTYIDCIEKADEDGCIFWSRHDIEVEMSEDYDKFIKNIKNLSLENLVMWCPWDTGVSITLVGHDYD